MPKTVKLLFIFFFIFSCTKTEVNKKNNALINNDTIIKTTFSKELIKKDTLLNYWELIKDTLFVNKTYKYLNDSIKLKVKTYSLNDSALVRNLFENNDNKVYLDHSHTMVSEVFFIKKDTIIDKIKLDKTNFKLNLQPDFYRECNLHSTEINSIFKNKIHLKTYLSVPDSDNVWLINYYLNLSDFNNSLNVTKVDYVGL